MRTPVAEIRQTLDAHLLSLLPGIGLTAADVAWPNAAFVPRADKPYLRAVCLFAKTDPASLGPTGFERLQGVYQADVVAVPDAGIERAEEIARAVVDHFRGGTELGCSGWVVRIRAAYPGPGTAEGGRYSLPVSMDWYCYAQK
jgi:hypothetical protein